VDTLHALLGADGEGEDRDPLGRQAKAQQKEGLTHRVDVAVELLDELGLGAEHA
jgi:hypothetical protein